MTQALREAIRRYTERHADAAGIARTSVRGLHLVRTTQAGELRHAIERPLICLVVQGAKQVTLGSRTLTFRAGESMLLTADTPTVSQITQASGGAPYLALALDLDAAVIAALCAEMKAAAVDVGPTLRFQPTEAEVADSALRMVTLLERPASIPLLQAQLVREVHYWLLAGRHGPAIRQLGAPESQARRIARAVEILRRDFRSPIAVGQLAAAARMSPSTFHKHFRTVTSLSPLQFQKQLRLIEARRLMLAKGLKPSVAAYEVGYESVPQFTREYRRQFGQPPGREIQQTRRGSQASEREHGTSR